MPIRCRTASGRFTKCRGGRVGGLGAVHLRQDVGTQEYENSHGAKPKGRGRWGFIFYLHGNPSEGETSGSIGHTYWFVPGSIWPQPTVTEAKRLALAEARRRGNVTRVEVAP